MKETLPLQDKLSAIGCALIAEYLNLEAEHGRRAENLELGLEIKTTEGETQMFTIIIARKDERQ